MRCKHRLTMEHITSTPSFETERSALIKLFEDGDFEQAKDLADKLNKQGCERPIICRTLYESFNNFVRFDPENAKLAAYAFKDYDFQCWLPPEYRQ